MINHCCMCDDNKAEVAELKALIREMGQRLRRFIAYGNVFGYRDWETTPFDDANEILSNPTVKRIMEKPCQETP